jgi:ubiquinone biosynthesis protein Coq4
VHDFWHVLTGCHTNVFGELALKALEFVQVRLLHSSGLCWFGFALGGLGLSDPSWAEHIHFIAVTAFTRHARAYG